MVFILNYLTDNYFFLNDCDHSIMPSSYGYEFMAGYDIHLFCPTSLIPHFIRIHSR